MANVTSNSSSKVEIHSYFGAIGYISLGFPTSLANFLVAASILKYSALRERKEMIILMGLALADGINTLGSGFAGVYRLRVLLSGTTHLLKTTSECLCLPSTVLWSFSIPLSYVMLVAVSVNRMLLVALREKYIFGMSRTYAYIVVGLSFGGCISLACISFVASLFWGHETPKLDAMCMVPFVFESPSFVSKLYMVWHQQSRTILGCMSLVIFALIAPVNKYRQAKVMPAGGGGSTLAAQMEKQQKLTKAIAISCGCTFLFVIVPGYLTYAFLEAGMKMAAWFCAVLFIANPLANVAIYHFRCEDMSKAMKGFLSCKELPQNLDLWHNTR